MPTTTKNYPAMTRREASVLLAAMHALREVGNRAAYAVAVEPGMDAYDAVGLGRLAAACSMADDVVFNALSAANVYCDSPQASAAIDRHLGR